jgi:hypothetical protein
VAELGADVGDSVCELLTEFVRIDHAGWESLNDVRSAAVVVIGLDRGGTRVVEPLSRPYLSGCG